ncbi:MAG: hypothetical protein Q4G35_03245 [Propionibacteriaceae bacterium]|nr:hypothetical protein [Propionibacteriaceae bacterium]
MVFQVPATSLEPFEFQLPGEAEPRKLTHLNAMPLGLKNQLAETAKPIAAAQKAGRQATKRQNEAYGVVLLKLFEFAAPGLTQLVDETQLAMILAAWQEHSGITAGESRASAGS